MKRPDTCGWDGEKAASQVKSRVEKFLLKEGPTWRLLRNAGSGAARPPDPQSRINILTRPQWNVNSNG